MIAPYDISCSFNEYFSQVGEKLLEDLNKKNPNMKDSDFTKYCDKATKHSLFLDPVGPDELLNLIKELKDSKSPGPDNIGPSLVKMISQTILFPLIDIFNKSLCTGIVPCKLKVAKVIPIYKKGDPKLTCNYRPISLLSIFDVGRAIGYAYY